MHCGTPLCYVASESWEALDTREVTWYLLDQGADPIPALECIRMGDDNPKFVENVKEWKATHGHYWNNCCLQ